MTTSGVNSSPTAPSEMRPDRPPDAAAPRRGGASELRSRARPPEPEAPLPVSVAARRYLGRSRRRAWRTLRGAPSDAGWQRHGHLSRSGAQPVQISFADALPRLQSGEIEAVLSSGDGGAGQRRLLSTGTALHRHQLFDDHEHGDHEPGRLERPPARRHKLAVLGAAQATSERQWAEIRNRVAVFHERMRANGVGITTEVPPEFLEALGKAGPGHHRRSARQSGAKRPEILDEYSEAQQALTKHTVPSPHQAAQKAQMQATPEGCGRAYPGTLSPRSASTSRWAFFSGLQRKPSRPDRGQLQRRPLRRDRRPGRAR